ncbi:DEAD/DEAH box helicase [Sulfurovum sp. bin170]|uniref:DEAD/DEAH box helicase n=1 Tax=Sulfurovum sp. bin170 TaxID=2695268 RepID=UPI0013DFC571|nr:DEAD/DEAH box helicase [Sulfurovum sp. bin170]NEW60787.1 DEAD/DEAH box helicase [Sulfurovum sp. bin170]
MPFTKLNLSKSLQQILQQNNYTEPTPIQKKVIPLVLKKQDIMAQAQTGSGKSASFVLPILELLSKNPTEGKRKIKVLVLTPTRELTLQVAETFTLFGKAISPRPKVVSVIGGEGIGEQIYAIQKGCDIVVATSGRFLDILSKNQMSLKHLEFLVLDEADKMLNLGFSEELDAILEAIPTKRQNLLFSATYPEKMLQIASKVTQKAIRVTIENETPTVANIKQRVIEVNPENRGPLLRYLLKKEKWKQVLVFMANRRATDNIAEKFRKRGYLAESFHGDLSQEDRNYTIAEFKAKKIQILFTTDIISRGLHIEGIDCVINFDLPRSPADYIHRIGRTGRAGKSGEAVTFIGHEEQSHFRVIEKRSQIKLEREQIKGYELIGEAPLKVKGKAPVKGKRKSKKDKLRELMRKEESS